MRNQRFELVPFTEIREGDIIKVSDMLGTNTYKIEQAFERDRQYSNEWNAWGNVVTTTQPKWNEIGKKMVITKKWNSNSYPSKVKRLVKI